MNGPEHYAEAERCLDTAARDFDRGNASGATFELQRAQVHATLAQAAATALNDSQGGTPTPEWHHWRVAAGFPARADHDFVEQEGAA
jgi:hypothetical protein